jgi:hypothetical protein
MALLQDLQSALSGSDGLTARQLAAKLRTTVRQVNPVLYRSSTVFQASGAEPPVWRLKSAAKSATKLQAKAPSAWTAASEAQLQASKKQVKQIKTLVLRSAGAAEGALLRQIERVESQLVVAEGARSASNLDRATKSLDQLIAATRHLVPVARVKTPPPPAARRTGAGNGAYGFTRCGHTGRCACRQT